MRFNPPPNWPPVPAGWTPDPHWRPDPSWPPPPPGWQLWVDDAVPYPETAPPYPSPSPAMPYPTPAVPYPSPAAPYPGSSPYAQQPYPPGYPHPFPVARPAKSSTAIWLVLAAVLAVVVLAAGSLWYFGGTGSGAASKKHNITALTKDLLLDRSQFSGFDGSEWHSEVGNAAEDMPDGGSGLTTEPAECSRLDAIASTNRATDAQTGASSLTGIDSRGTRTASMSLMVPAPELNVKQYVDRCREYTSTSQIGDETLTQKTKLRLLEPSGLPRWASAYSMNIESDTEISELPPLHADAVMIQGIYRGVLVHAGQFTMSHDAGFDAPVIAGKLTTLFNAQVAKLEAAP